MDPFEQSDEETDALGAPWEAAKAVPLVTPYPTYPKNPKDEEETDVR